MELPNYQMNIGIYIKSFSLLPIRTLFSDVQWRHYDVMIWVFFHSDFSKKSFKSGFVPIEKIFLLFLVIVFFSETSFQLLTKEKADLSETKWTHELNPFTSISNRHCWYQILKIQKTSPQKLEKFGCWEIMETVLRILILKIWYGS